MCLIFEQCLTISPQKESRIHKESRVCLFSHLKCMNIRIVKYAFFCWSHSESLISEYLLCFQLSHLSYIYSYKKSKICVILINRKTTTKIMPTSINDFTNQQNYTLLLQKT